MAENTDSSTGLAPETEAFYREALETLHAAGVPVLVGGAYAFAHYTGITRHTKDFDLFLARDDVERALAVCRDAGYETEFTSQTWIAKARHGEDLVDLIFAAPNGVARVDEAWFDRSDSAPVFGVPARLVPAEEILWSKAYVMDRARYDGADVAHLLRACADDLDWEHLLARFRPHPRVLLNHLILFGFIYPGEQGRIPARVLRALLAEMEAEANTPPPERVCRGTLLSRRQYAPDTEEWGYADARARPWGRLTAEEVAELNADAQ